MGTTAEKLVYLGQTKADIRNAIIAKGVTVPTDTTFRNYATKISEIETNQKLVDYAARVNNDGGNIENTPLLTPFIKTLTTEKLALLPSGKKVGKLYSQLPISGDSDATVVRNGTATYKDANGIIQTAQANVARIEDGALLLEPQTTNLTLYSEDFSKASWAKEQGATISLNTELSPTGSLNASYLNAPDGVNIYPRITYTFSSTASQTYTLSIFVKKYNINYIRMISTGATASTLEAWYNVANGTLGTSGAPSKAKIEDYGNEWYRLSLIVNATLTASATFRIQLSKGDGNVINNFNLSEKNIIWGAQVELGSIATSYIPTLASTVTRVADVITIPIPIGTTSIIETINEVDQTPITTFGATHTVSNGKINKVIML
jgi:hypothetical protein